MELKVVLKNCPPDTLVSIADFWNLRLPESCIGPEPAHRRAAADHLAPRLQTAQYFRAALARLDEPERDLLRFLAMHGGKLSLAEVAARCFNAHRTACERAVAHLTDKGFAFIWDTSDEPGDRVVVVPEAFLRLIELPPTLGGYLGAMLRELPREQIDALSTDVLGESQMPHDRGSAVYLLRRTMLDPEWLRAYVQKLPEGEQDILAFVLKRRGSCLYRDVLDAKSQKRLDPQRAEQLNTLLTTRGLLFTAVANANKYDNLLVLPRDILFVLQNDFLPDCRPLKDLLKLALPGQHTPAVVHEAGHTLLRDLVLIAGFFECHPVKRLAGGGVNRNDLKKILPVLKAPNPAKYAQFLIAFLLARRMLAEAAGTWRPSDTFRRWLAGDAHQCYWDVYSWWLLESDWDEASADGCTSDSDVLPSRAGMMTLRKLALQSIACYPSSTWIPFPPFAESVLPHIDAACKGVGLSRGGRSAGTRWILGALRGIVLESLPWLGLASIGSPAANGSSNGEHNGNHARTPTTQGGNGHRDDDRTMFMPSALGAWLLRRDVAAPNIETGDGGTGDAPLPEYGAEQFIMQPNLEIIVPPDLALDRLYELSRLCTVRNLDVVVTMEVTRETLRAAMDRGMTAEEILEFFGRCSRVQVPETFRHLVTECSSRHGEIRIGSASGYLLAEDPMVIQEIRANPRFADAVREVIGDRLALLSPNIDIAKLAREMQGAGMMPNVESSMVRNGLDGRYHVTLSSEELCDLLAAMRLVARIEEELRTDLSGGRALTLAQRLRAAVAGVHGITQQTESVATTYEKKYQAAFGKIIGDMSEKYRTQVSRLVSKGIGSRRPSKYQFRGPNPATERSDINALLSYAVDYELEAEIVYIRSNDQEAKISVAPKSMEGDRLYARCRQNDMDTIYSLDRILRARLV